MMLNLIHLQKVPKEKNHFLNHSEKRLTEQPTISQQIIALAKNMNHSTILINK